MDFGEFLGGIGTVDLLLVLYFIGFFVLGFAQGTIRRLLGIVQAAIILGAAIVILDSFFAIPGMPTDPQELPFLREIWTALDETQIVAIFRETLIPAFFVLTGFLVPDTIEANSPLD